MDIRACGLFHNSEKCYRKLERSTQSIKNVYLMVEDPPEVINFSLVRSRIPRIQQQFFFKKIKDPHDPTKKLCGQDPGSTESFDEMSTQDPSRSRILDPADPGR